MSHLESTATANHDVHNQTSNIFQRPTLAHIQVTDVGDGERDFDARETERAGHLQIEGYRAYGVDGEHGLKYAAQFFNGWPDLVRDTVDRSVNQADIQGRETPAQVLRAQKLLRERTLRVVLNAAPRNQALAENVNGRSFLTIVTRSGVEFHCTPAEAAGYIGPDIECIYVNPTETNPLFGPEEQFRSRTVGLTGLTAPENLQVLWKRGQDPESALHDIIKPPTHDEVGYIDKPFHNRRIVTPDRQKMWHEIHQQKSYDGTVRIAVGQSVVRAYISKSLRTIPEGQWGVYGNPADAAQEPGHLTAYELTRRYDKGKNWFDKGQNPDDYLKRKDQRLGVPVHVLPKAKVRDTARFFFGRLKQYSPIQ